MCQSENDNAKVLRKFYMRNIGEYWRGSGAGSNVL